MAEAKRDQNHVTVALGVSSSDSVTPIMFTVDPSTNYLLMELSADSLVTTAATIDKRDQNFVPTCYGISSVDNTTLVPIRTDTDGKLLVQIT